MMILAGSIRDLRMRELMEVYQDSNLEAASDRSDLPPLFALELAERDFQQYLNEVFFPTAGAVMALWENDGRYVSALRLEPYRDGLLLEALETMPAERKKGHAASLICSVQQYLREHGSVKLYSHVNKRNIGSLRTHEKCGFRRSLDYAVYISGSVDYRCWTLVFEA